MQDRPSFDSTQPVDESELTPEERAYVAGMMARKHAADELDVPEVDSRRPRLPK